MVRINVAPGKSLGNLRKIPGLYQGFSRQYRGICENPVVTTIDGGGISLDRRERALRVVAGFLETAAWMVGQILAEWFAAESLA